MMKRLRKIIAGFLCLCMMVSANGFSSFAMGSTEQQDALADETATDSDAAEASDAADTATASDAQEAPLLNYLVVGSDYISTPGSQYILADAGAEGTLIESAVLSYVNQSNGAAYQKKADTISDTAMLFNLDFSDESCTGVYKVTGIAIVIDGITYNIDVETTGISAVFGVNSEVDTEPDAWVTEDDGTQENAASEGIVIADIDGNQLTAGDIAGVVAEVSDTGSLRSGSNKDNIVVVLDPGHGNAGDTGAVYTWNGVTYVERDINLKIAQYCKAALEQYSGVTVYMTRTDNVNGLQLAANEGETIGPLVQYAKSVDADILVSIHNNSASASANGSEVYYPNSNYNPIVSNTGKELSELVLSKLEELGLYNRGAKIRYSEDPQLYPDGSVADYYGIIRQSKLCGFPGIIIEHAFLTNQSDAENFLGSEAALKKLGEADAAAIAEYFGLTLGDVKYIYNGVDYSAVFDFDYYVSTYPDIAKAYGSSVQGALSHFVNFGMKEGRQGCETFNVTSYRLRYADLRQAFGSNLPKYYMHYITNGQKEGRIATGTVTIQNPATVYNGVDYSLVYNFDYYVNKYADIKKLYGSDDTGALKHFVNYGMKEGRQGCEAFDVNSYKNAYADLRLVFGSDLSKYYLHYIKYGKSEGRIAVGVTTVQNPITTYKGTDYSAVYDYTYYISAYSDIKTVFGNDDVAALAHFVNHGVSEGRQAIDSFSVTSYLYQYQDLRKAFGTDLAKYVNHYITKGIKEGRIAVGVTSMQNPVTVYNGTDYSAVYDYIYYVKNNSTVRSKYNNDDFGALKYFVETGMKNGDVASEQFNISYYKENYSDLKKALGSNNILYYQHYMKYGVKEGRVADRQLLTCIMGESTTTVSQMAAYYKANAVYPAYYADSDAPTIEAFCQLYLDECKAEGVNAEVAFCQAMKETGFLKFGGSVKIEQYNFAGLGATDSGGASASFDTVRLGIRAQVQHLKAYACTDSLNNTCVDPRFDLVTRGCAEYVEWLGVNENPNGKGWATAVNYGYSIKNDYIAKLKTY